LITKDVAGFAYITNNASTVPVDIVMATSADTFKSTIKITYTPEAIALFTPKLDFIFFNTTTRIYISAPQTGNNQQLCYMESLDAGKTWKQINIIKTNQSNVGVCQLPNEEMAMVTWRYTDIFSSLSPNFTQLFGYLTNHTVNTGVFA
jgi:hypothetical protein